MADSVFLVEQQMISPAGVAMTLRWSDQAIRPFPPGDAMRPNAVFDDRLDEAPVLRRRLVEDMASLTPGWGVGALSLINGDRALDAYQAHVWGALRVLRWTPGTSFSSASLLFAGVAGAPRYVDSRKARVQLSLSDYRAELDKALQQTLYAGTGLYEGAVDTIKGRPKPLAYGDLTGAHLPAVLVQASVQGYQLHDGAIDGGVQIFDRGDNAGLTLDADKVGPAFDAWNPAAAHAVTDQGRGLLKINSTPVGGYAFGCRGDAVGGYVQTAGPILRRLLLRLGVASGRIDASVAALTAAAPIGVWTQDAGDGRKVIEHVARSVLSAILPGRDGIWRAYTIAPPAVVADYVLDPQDIQSIDADTSAPVPAGAVRIGWGRIWTTYRSQDLAPALRGTTAGDRLAEEYRWAVDEDATVKARLAETWRTIEIETALRAEADALALAAQILDLFGLRPDGKPRRAWKVVVPLDDEHLAVELGKTVRVVWSPYAIDDRYLLIGEEPCTPRPHLMTWTVWG